MEIKITYTEAVAITYFSIGAGLGGALSALSPAPPGHVVLINAVVVALGLSSLLSLKADKLQSAWERVWGGR